METGVVLMILGLGLLSGSALLAFSWAARDGQLDDLEDGARVIFEDEELNQGGHGDLGGGTRSAGLDIDPSKNLRGKSSEAHSEKQG